MAKKKGHKRRNRGHRRPSTDGSSTSHHLGFRTRTSQDNAPSLSSARHEPTAGSVNSRDGARASAVSTQPGSPDADTGSWSGFSGTFMRRLVLRRTHQRLLAKKREKVRQATGDKTKPKDLEFNRPFSDSSNGTKQNAAWGRYRASNPFARPTAETPQPDVDMQDAAAAEDDDVVAQIAETDWIKYHLARTFKSACTAALTKTDRQDMLVDFDLALSIYSRYLDATDMFMTRLQEVRAAAERAFKRSDETEQPLRAQILDLCDAPFLVEIPAEPFVLGQIHTVSKEERDRLKTEAAPLIARANALGKTVRFSGLPPSFLEAIHTVLGVWTQDVNTCGDVQGGLQQACLAIVHFGTGLPDMLGRVVQQYEGLSHTVRQLEAVLAEAPTDQSLTLEYARMVAAIQKQCEEISDKAVMILAEFKALYLALWAHQTRYGLLAEDHFIRLWKAPHYILLIVLGLSLEDDEAQPPTLEDLRGSNIFDGRSHAGSIEGRQG